MGRGLPFWLLVLVVVHGELSEDQLRRVILLKTNGTEPQQFTSPSLAPTPCPIGSVPTESAAYPPPILGLHSILRVDDGRYPAGLLTAGLRISYTAIGSTSLVWNVRPALTREWSSNIQDQHVKVIAHALAGELGMTKLDQLGASMIPQ